VFKASLFTTRAHRLSTCRALKTRLRSGLMRAKPVNKGNSAPLALRLEAEIH
jgi:hypothetical protein